MFDIIELNGKKVAELREIATKLGVARVDKLKKQDLVYSILDEQAARPNPKGSTQKSEGASNSRSGRSRKGNNSKFLATIQGPIAMPKNRQERPLTRRQQTTREPKSIHPTNPKSQIHRMPQVVEVKACENVVNAAGGKEAQVKELPTTQMPGQQLRTEATATKVVIVVAEMIEMTGTIGMTGTTGTIETTETIAIGGIPSYRNPKSMDLILTGWSKLRASLKCSPKDMHFCALLTITT